MTLSARSCRIGLMGLGQIGRQIFRLAAARPDLEIVAVADIGKPEVLRYLLETTGEDFSCRLEGNHLRGPGYSARMLQLAGPGDVPWDAFGVDCVIDATGRFRSRAHAERQLAAGAGRLLYATLCEEPPDRLLVPGINDAHARPTDRVVSAGSPTTNAFALLVDAVDRAFGVEYASMTSIHAYTSDQPLQDYAQGDERRSRSAAQNIIPNANQSAAWVEHLLPHLAGRLSGLALNVPVQRGSLLDVDVVLAKDEVGIDMVNAALIAAAADRPALIGIATDPIVSSDVIGCSQSLLFDTQATQRAGRRLLKTLGWYETLGHASRVLEVAAIYAGLDNGDRA